ncbi:MAG: hypothetical protein WCS43_03200 [Verrucomicrobiota bacterium]
MKITRTIFRSGWLAAALVLSTCGKKTIAPARATPMEPAAFWVWHRSSPLKPADSASLGKAGVRSLYWQAAECGWEDGRWKTTRISPPMADDKDLEIIPVFRIKPGSAFLGSPNAARLLAGEIHAWSDRSPPPGDIQIDFDCPVRLLDSYARFLKSFGVEIAPARVSITALASWPQHAGFRELALSVKSLVPMFYDLEADAAEDVMENRFHPMADDKVAEWMLSWADCPRPWLAGLPNFERLSVFESDGRLIGHLRGWEHDPVFFNCNMNARALGNGTTIFHAEKPVMLYGTEITPERKLVHRTCDPQAILKLAEQAGKSGASGILYFALPGPGIQAALTPDHLVGAARHAQASPVLDIAGNGTVTFKNPGPFDVQAGRWELELSTDHAGAFLSCQPGGFVESETPGGLPAELATTVILRFSKLPSGAAITSGPVIRNAAGIKWKLREALEKNIPSRNDFAR